jgi:hypothetical protein
VSYGPRMSSKWLVIVLVAAGACKSEDAPWDKGLEQTNTLYGARRGFRQVRGPIHIHSPYSHDACDKMGYVDGVIDQRCLGDLRTGFCKTHQDFAMITDHADFMTAVDWDQTFLPQPGDEVVMVDGQHVASRWTCADGFQTLVMVGSENELMPLGLHEHVAATTDERVAILKGTDGATAATLRQHGAIIAVAHGESHDLAQLMAVDAGVLEIYNIHANLGPDIRAMLGQDATAPLTALLPFILMEDHTLEPDMAFLLFWEDNPFELAKLESMWGAGKHVLASLGVDSHENVISGLFEDGERGDAHRRLLRWFSNHLLVTETSPQAITDAIAHARGFGVFEVFGDVVGFDYRAEHGGTYAEIGDTVASGAQLIVDPPEAVGDNEARLRILRIDASGSVEVAAGPADEALVYTATAPGAYRAEVRVKPHGLRHLLGIMGDSADKEFAWVYTSPIYVGP